MKKLIRDPGIRLAAAGLFALIGSAALTRAAEPPAPAAENARGPGPAAAGRDPRKDHAGPVSARAGAMLDLSGYWVSVVTEDWIYRMLTAPKGDAGSLPVNDAGRKAAAAWDPTADVAAGNSCKINGAGGNIRRPGRLHITWQDDDTLRVDFSAGNQTRLLAFKQGTATPAPEQTWQGRSIAEWVRVRNWPQFAPPTVAPVGGTLKVETTNMRSGYLQSNGFPYSADAKMTEYFDRVTYDGEPWLIVTTVIEDPMYLRDSLYWSTPFKQESNGAHWKPKPCGT